MKIAAFIITICWVNFFTIFPQIGINTELPQGIVHVNPKKDTSDVDDFVITSEGNVGIGTISPVNKLEIIAPLGATNVLRLTDGISPKAGYRLQADADGFGKWDTGVNLDRQVGDNLLGIIPTNTNTYTGKKITLPPGTWVLRYSLTWRITSNPSASKTGVAIIGVLLSTSSTSYTSTFVPGTWSFAPIAYTQYYHSSQMSVFYKNATTQTLYMWVYWNGAPTITSVTSYEPLGVGTGNSNILEAIRW